jgi:YbgC/YbaW family acyl-CoA thioester hydrolase
MSMNPVSRADFRFYHPLRVRWAEVDMHKIVFNAHYLMYFDTAISDYWRALALPYEQAMEHLGGDLYVKKAALEYHASAHFDDRLDIGQRCARIGSSSIQFQGAVFRGDELLVESEIVYVYADSATRKSRPVPEALRDLITGYEAGQDVAEIRLGSWTQLGEAACRLRTEVFVQEQNVPVELEWDAEDDTALHAVTFNRLGMPVATSRLLQHAPEVAKIGRMAVSRVLRGSGLGRDLLLALMDAARRRGDRAVLLHAQRDAIAFYTRLGFKGEGELFEEAGIPHLTMRCELRAAPA